MTAKRLIRTLTRVLDQHDRKDCRVDMAWTEDSGIRRSADPILKIFQRSKQGKYGLQSFRLTRKLSPKFDALSGAFASEVSGGPWNRVILTNGQESFVLLELERFSGMLEYQSCWRAVLSLAKTLANFLAISTGEPWRTSGYLIRFSGSVGEESMHVGAVSSEEPVDLALQVYRLRRDVAKAKYDEEMSEAWVALCETRR